MYVFFLIKKSGNFLTCIIILLIFIRGEKEHERGEEKKEKKSCSYVRSYQVDPTIF